MIVVGFRGWGISYLVLRSYVNLGFWKEGRVSVRFFYNFFFVGDVVFRDVYRLFRVWFYLFIL